MVKQNFIVGNVAIHAHADMRNTAAIPRAIVTAHPVIGDLIIVATRVDTDTARCCTHACRQTDNRFNCAVHRHRIVVDIDIQVIRNERAIHIRYPCLTILSNTQTAIGRTSITIDTVIGNFQIVCPAVYINSTTAITTRYGNTVNS